MKWFLSLCLGLLVASAAQAFPRVAVVTPRAAIVVSRGFNQGFIAPARFAGYNNFSVVNRFSSGNGYYQQQFIQPFGGYPVQQRAIFVPPAPLYYQQQFVQPFYYQPQPFVAPAYYSPGVGQIIGPAVGAYQFNGYCQ